LRCLSLASKYNKREAIGYIYALDYIMEFVHHGL